MTHCAPALNTCTLAHFFKKQDIYLLQAQAWRRVPEPAKTVPLCVHMPLPAFSPMRLPYLLEQLTDPIIHSNA